MSKRLTLVSAVLACMALVGCATPFTQYYQDNLLNSSSLTIPHVGEPRLITGTNPDADHIRMVEDGYRLKGVSNFSGPERGGNGALEQAKKIGAAVVIIYSKHTETISGVAPLTMPTTQIATTNASGNVFGSRGGMASYMGTATTTTTGSQTTYIPYTVRRADQFASYWMRGIPPIFGADTMALSPEVTRQIGTNKGIQIRAVVKGSPAFNADLLSGDVISQVDGSFVYDGRSFSSALAKSEGKLLTVLIYRDGKSMEKQVQIRRAD